jgi:hypothetical protein
LRETNYNTGLRGVLFDSGHYTRMGAAVWLYGWLILRQTHQSGTIGWVLGGAPIHYREIEEETGFNRRTLERWMKNLRRQKYIETTVVDSGITIRILKAKKHLQPRTNSKGVREIAGGVRKSAVGSPQKCVGIGSETHSGQRVTSGIGSSSVVRIKEKQERESEGPVGNASSASEILPANATNKAGWAETTTSGENPNHKGSWTEQNQPQSGPAPSSRETRRDEAWNSFHSVAAPRSESPAQTQRHRSSSRETSTRENERPSTQQNFSWDLRERMRLIRAERDEAVRRELAVGSGPEVRRQ